MNKSTAQGFSLSGKTCTVIGTGGLGCNIAVHLAGAGTQNLILCDYDNVSESNLNRQFLYTKEDIGKSKVFCAKQRLGLYAPEINITAFNIRIGKDSFPDEIKSSDMIFLAVDNLAARKAAAAYCEENNIPLMMGGIDGFYGKTYLYIPFVTPTPDEAGMLEGAPPSFNISSSAGIIGSLQASAGIQYILTKDNSLGGKLTVFDKDSFSELYIKPKTIKK